MFVIRQEQIDVLQTESVRRFAGRMVAHLRRAFPGRLAGTPQGDLLAQVEWSIEEAKGFGIETEADLRTDLECAAVLGFDFANNPGDPMPGGLLRSRELSAERKMDLISEHALTAELAATATGAAGGTAGGTAPQTQEV